MLDTHVWIWWVQGDSRLGPDVVELLDARDSDTTGISVMSCWEFAMLHRRERISVSCTLDEWLDAALAYPGVCLLEMSREIAVNSCRLPDTFHRDPIDRMLFSTAMLNECKLVTEDRQILSHAAGVAIRPRDLLARSPE